MTTHCPADHDHVTHRWSNKGLGFETARQLIVAGQEVWIAARDQDRGPRSAGACLPAARALACASRRQRVESDAKRERTTGLKHIR